MLKLPRPEVETSENRAKTRAPRDPAVCPLRIGEVRRTEVVPSGPTTAAKEERGHCLRRFVSAARLH